MSGIPLGCVLLLVECLVHGLHILGGVNLIYGVNVRAYFDLSLNLLDIFRIVDSQIRC